MTSMLSFGRLKAGSLYGIWMLLAVVTAGCGNWGEKDVRNYYFPIRELQDGLVYEYQPVGNEGLTPVYWYYRSFLSKDSVLLTGTYYEYELLPLQLVKEKLVGNGVLLQELLMYPVDSMGEQQTIKAGIIAGNVFPFEVRDSNKVYLYKVKLEFPGMPGASTTLIKNRRYVGDTTFVWQGKTLPAIKFSVREMVEDLDPNDGVVEPEYRGEEIYAEGLGLVYYKKIIYENLFIAYQLERRYPMEMLEQLFLERRNTSEEGLEDLEEEQ
jgi:hypothetical protein